MKYDIQCTIQYRIIILPYHQLVHIKPFAKTLPFTALINMARIKVCVHVHACVCKGL
jgi:hypothetical protein